MPPLVRQSAWSRSARTSKCRGWIGRKHLMLVEIRVIERKETVVKSVVIRHGRLINLRNTSIENSEPRPHHQRMLITERISDSDPWRKILLLQWHFPCRRPQ